MTRFTYLRRFALLLAVSCLGLLPCHAQDTSLINKYRPQLGLIDSIRAFISSDLGLYVQSTYYTAWNEEHDDSMYIYLYVSIAKRVEADTALGKYIFFNNEAKAMAKSKELEAKGFQTLLYKTAGNSTTRLSTKLLSYPPEAIAYILFHEVTHQNVHKDGGGIPYIFEEALCDVVANSACVRFAEKAKMIDLKSAQKQRDIFEKTYAFLNDERQMLNTLLPPGKAAFYKECTGTIKAMTQDGNQFVKDRMDYEVNNAYFLRIEDYAKNYFKVKKMYAVRFDFKDVVKQIQEMQKR